MTTTESADAAKQFAGKMLGLYTGAVLTTMIDIGYQTGLFEAAKAGPASSGALAERAGLAERYVREWLGAMVTGGIFTFDPDAGRYTLPVEHAIALTGGGARNLAPTSRVISHFGKQIAGLVECFRKGGGLPYSVFRPEFTHAMDDAWRRVFDEHLVDGFIGSIEGLTAKLTRGIRVLDVGCGTGHAINLLARAFPHSSFHGFDIAEDAIDAAQSEATLMGLANAVFNVADASELTADLKFDLVLAFDAIHDQRAPDVVLARINEALAPGGTFLMIEFKFDSKLEANVKNPFAPMYYGFSCMHCMTVSLASGGPGLGAVWGEQTARRMLADAGFGRVDVLGSPRPQNCIFVCRH